MAATTGAGTNLRRTSPLLRVGTTPRFPGDRSILQAEEIARVFAGFRQGRPIEVEVVRGWVHAVVRGGNWRFSDPEGVAQETLLALVKLAGSGRIREPGGFQKLVYTVAKNTCVDVYHRERRRDSREVAEEFPDERPGGEEPGEELSQRERLDRLVQIFQRLPEACRQLWDWVYREGCSAAEVANRLSITAGNVRVRVHRCLEKAREIHRELESWPVAADDRK